MWGNERENSKQVSWYKGMGEVRIAISLLFMNQFSRRLQGNFPHHRRHYLLQLSHTSHTPIREGLEVLTQHIQCIASAILNDGNRDGDPQLRRAVEGPVDNVDIATGLGVYL